MEKIQSISSLIPSFSDYREKILSEDPFDELEANSIDEIHLQFIAKIKQGNRLEKTILPEAKNLGKEEYNRVRNLLVSLGNQEISSRIIAWEGVGDFYTTVPAEQKVRVSAALGTRVDEVSEDADQSGNIFTLEQRDGTKIDYDVMSNERSLTVDGYTLGSQVEDRGDYQTPKLAYMRVEQEHLPQLEKIVAAGKAIDQASVSDDNVTQIKDILRDALGYTYFVQLGLDRLDDATEIQKTLGVAYQEHSESLEEAREEYRDKLLELRDGHFAALERKDKKTKEVLNFLREIGVTEIPQSIFTQIVEQINGRDGLRAMLGFSEKIDLENGQLGMNKDIGDEGIDEPLDLQDKKAFAEVINKMLGFTAVNIGLIGSGAPVGDRTKFQTRLRESGLLDVGGVQTAMNNLSKIELRQTVQ